MNAEQIFLISSLDVLLRLSLASHRALSNATAPPEGPFL